MCVRVFTSHSRTIPENLAIKIKEREREVRVIETGALTGAVLDFCPGHLGVKAGCLLKEEL